MSNKIPDYCDYVVSIKSIRKVVIENLRDLLSRCNFIKDLGKNLMIKYNFSEVFCSNDEINLIFRYEDDDKLMDNYVSLLNGNIMRIVTQLVSEATLNSEAELFCGNLFLFEKENSLNDWLKKKQIDCYNKNINIIYRISIDSLEQDVNIEEKLNEYGILDALKPNDFVLNGSLIELKKLI